MPKQCRVLVIVLPCYGALEIVGVIIIIIIINVKWQKEIYIAHSRKKNQMRWRIFLRKCNKQLMQNFLA